MKTDRRQHPRARIQCPVIIKVARRYVTEAHTLDIGPGGALIRCGETLTLNQTYPVALANVPVLNRHLSIFAEVVRSGTSGPANKPPVYDVAVRFTKIFRQANGSIMETIRFDELRPLVSCL